MIQLPLPIEAKQALREILTARMNAAKVQAGLAKVGAIVVQERDLERFLDEVWFDLNKKLYEASQKDQHERG